MTGILPFDFESYAVRIQMEDGSPVFVASDVCRALEISKYRDAVARLDGDERVSILVDTLGGEQTMTAVTESGLYALIFASNKPAAKRFRKWVTAEVLPAIRHNGYYALPEQDREELSGKRAYFEGLPDRHKDLAETRTGALAQLDEMIDAGERVGAAVEMVAEELGVSPRTIWNYRRAVYMVPRDDRAAALAPKWSGKRGMLADCHVDARLCFLDLIADGARPSSAYRKMREEADAQGWRPIPSERTMRRLVQADNRGRIT